ncbi:MAG: hypothetical protein AAGB04_00070 [Pseudomonadota bacterium]
MVVPIDINSCTSMPQLVEQINDVLETLEVEGTSGDPGLDATVTVEGTNTLPAGSNASVTDSNPSSNVANLTFGIPQGLDGNDGDTPNLTIGTVTTLAAGASATALITGTTPNLVLNLGIPQGADGSGGTGSQSTEFIGVVAATSPSFTATVTKLRQGADPRTDPSNAAEQVPIVPELGATLSTNDLVWVEENEDGTYSALTLVEGSDGSVCFAIVINAINRAYNSLVITNDSAGSITVTGVLELGGSQSGLNPEGRSTNGTLALKLVRKYLSDPGGVDNWDEQYYAPAPGSPDYQEVQLHGFIGVGTKRGKVVAYTNVEGKDTVIAEDCY